jgi:hypothetical protein
MMKYRVAGCWLQSRREALRYPPRQRCWLQSRRDEGSECHWDDAPCPFQQGMDCGDWCPLFEHRPGEKDVVLHCGNRVIPLEDE